MSVLRFHPDGRRIALASQVWDYVEGKKVLEVPRAIASFGPDGTVFAAVGNDEVSIHDTTTGLPLLSWQFTGPVHMASFAPDGRHLATANGNGTIYILRLDSADLVVPKTLTAAEAKQRQAGAAGKLGVPVEATNSIGMKMNLIPAGRFFMGSPDTEPGRNANEGPQHAVAISRAFYLGIHEVTVAQFKAFVKEADYKTEAEKNGKDAGRYENGQNVLDPKCNWRTPGYEQGDTHPVVCVSWNDANAFCAWLSKKEGKKYPCRPRPNGNMPAGQERRRRISSASIPP
jgi:WD40 repeat protein